MSVGKVYKIKEDAREMLREKTVEIIIEKKETIREAEVLHALIYKFLDKLTANDVIKYKEETDKN